MYIEIDREDGLGVRVTSGDPDPDYLKFDIDIRKREDSSWFLRMDGLGFFGRYAFLSKRDLRRFLKETLAGQGPALIRSHWELIELPEAIWQPDEVLSDFFETARKAALDSLQAKPGIFASNLPENLKA